MKKIISILLCLPALGYAMEAPVKTHAEIVKDIHEAYSQHATQQLLKELDRMFPFTFGKEKELKQLLNTGANPNIQDNNGNTVLILASRLSYPDDFIEFLLQKGANPNIQNNEGDTALMHSLSAASTQKLLEFNANPDIRSRVGLSPMIDSIINKKAPRKVSILLEWGANLNTAYINGTTALILATNKKNPEIVQMLVQAGADTQARDTLFCIALDYAHIGLQLAQTDAERATNQAIVDMLTNPQNIQRSGLKKLE